MKKLVALLLIVLTMLFTFGACGGGNGDGGDSNSIRISFDTSGKVHLSSISVKVGEVPQMPETPEVEGFVFAGWYFDEELENRYFFDYALEGDTTLYAKFYDVALGEYVVISNLEQLLTIKDAPDAKYLFACSINCKGETLEPINTFTGEIDGNGYTIFNFAIKRGSNNTGFVGVNKGTIKNLSFSDFIFDIINGSEQSKNIAVVCGKNYATVQNCHVLDGEIKVRAYTVNESVACLGSIVGDNDGIIKNCTNRANLTIENPSGGGTAVGGGIVGRSNANGEIARCVNRGKIDFCIEDQSWINTNTGGVIGTNNGKIEHSANFGDINVYHASSSRSGSARSNIGAFVGNAFNGEIRNSYAICEVKANLTKNHADCWVGGFSGRNNGKIYNCYSDVNLDVTCKKAHTVGGFVGTNVLSSGKEALISKCFALGTVKVNQALTHCGCFAGASTGDISVCVYSDSLAINLKSEETNEETGEVVEILTALETTCKEGEAKPESEILSVDFLENTLYFDRMIWLLAEGELPILR